MPSKIEIAFRRKVRAVWLDQGMALAAGNLPWQDAKPALAGAIAEENPGAETIRKVLEHVRRIWFEPPTGCERLHADALELYRSRNSAEVRFLLNWGMTVAAYPFVGSVAEALGRLLKLQQQAHRADIQRRLREQHGDRDFVSRITRYDVSSFLDWGVILEARARSAIYTAGTTISLKNPGQIAWLAEAVLISRRENQMALSHLTNHPVLFPITLQNVSAAALRTNPRIHIGRQSLNEEVVSLHSGPSAAT